MVAIPGGMFKSGVVGDTDFATWNKELHKMTLTVVADIPAGDQIVFYFDIKNPCCHQESPVVCIKASRLSGACAKCDADAPGLVCGDSECGKCASIDRQMLDRDFATLFTKGTIGDYGYTKEYGADAVVTYGAPNLGDAVLLLLLCAMDDTTTTTTTTPYQRIAST